MRLAENLAAQDSGIPFPKGNIGVAIVVVSGFA